MRERGLPPFPVSRSSLRDLYWTLAQMVADGAGVTLLPQLAVATEVRRARLAVRPFADPAPGRTIALSWRRRSPTGPALRRLATTARLLYEEAAFRRAPMRLNLDLDKQVYWVTILDLDADGGPDFVPDTTPLARPVALPDAVAFADVVLPALGTVREGVVFAQFLPEGYADPLVVHLTNRRSEYATLAVEPLTGRTRIGEGYLELETGRMRAPDEEARSGTRRRDLAKPPS